MKTTNDHITLSVQRMLQRKGVTEPTVLEDLTDHLCCLAEENLATGYGINASVDKAFQEFGEAEIESINTEIVNLLITYKFTKMKRTALIISLLGVASIIGAVLLFSNGTLNKGQLILMSMTSLLVATGGLAWSYAYTTDRKRRRFSNAVGIIGSILTSNGIVLSILHIPSARIQLIVGAFLLIFSFLPFVFYNLYKRVQGTGAVLYFAGYFGSALALLGAIFKVQHWPGANILLIVGLVVFNLFLIAYFARQKGTQQS